MKKLMYIIQIFILFVLLVAGYQLIDRFQGDTIVQFLIAAIVSVGYSLWGIIYHILAKDLHARIVLEYMLVSLVVLTLFSMLILY